MSDWPKHYTDDDIAAKKKDARRKQLHKICKEKYPELYELIFQLGATPRDTYGRHYK